MYQTVLVQGFKAINMDDTEFFAPLWLVIDSIVIVFNPLSLVAILGVKMAKAWTLLCSLYSIFIVPDSESEPIRLCDKSLADYLTDKTRCTDLRFYINPSVFHLGVSLLRCLRLMNASMKNNICELPRYAEIDDLDGHRQNYIGSGGCRSRAMHLRVASRDGDNARHVVECLKELVEHHLLR